MSKQKRLAFILVPPGKRRKLSKYLKNSGNRAKVMRGLKRQDTPIFKRYQIYHNYLRPHEGLDGRTPADASGIKIEGDNKWVTLIHNASK